MKIPTRDPIFCNSIFYHQLLLSPENREAEICNWEINLLGKFYDLKIFFIFKNWKNVRMVFKNYKNTICDWIKFILSTVPRTKQVRQRGKFEWQILWLENSSRFFLNSKTNCKTTICNSIKSNFVHWTTNENVSHRVKFAWQILWLENSSVFF